MSVMRGLDPRIHLLRKKSPYEIGWIAGSSPAMTTLGRSAFTRTNREGPHDGLRRWHRQHLGAGEKPRPSALRQGNAGAHALAQDRVPALARKVDALDPLVGRQRCNAPRQVVRFLEHAVAIAERGEIDGNGNAIEKRGIELAARGKRGRDDRISHREAAKALDHEGEA